MAMTRFQRAAKQRNERANAMRLIEEIERIVGDEVQSNAEQVDNISVLIGRYRCGETV